ncbi:ankyrin repeat domain-containing protein 53 [Hemibagrus wyckioides]|uniref:ankyrin repeat domain-containing protein 53 n=1 Tax=Hemibagrus wyckioides TaxID=337641 RepID=UPI00266BD4F6|nr:ankyrin repeat domain-containing protein 53 [Hemibagrus wyckioides]
MDGACPARARKLPAGDLFHAAVCGDPRWLCLTLDRVQSPGQQHNKQGLTVLHVAAQHGQLNCLKLLLESGTVDVNASCLHGRRPLHMVLSPESKPNTYSCLTYLLEHGAEPNVSTDEGLTPLHMAAAEGLEECVEELVRVGADTHTHDSRGHTPFELACLWGHRVAARILKNAMWHKDKKRDMEKHQELQNLKQNMIRMYRKAEGMQKLAREAINKQKVSEWAERKGLPCLRSPTTGLWTLSHHCCHSAKPVKKQHATKWNISPNPSRHPPANISRSETVRIGVHPEEVADEPDLCQSVTLHCFRNGQVQCIASWDNVPQLVPDLPMDVIQKGLFPSKFPPRISGPLQLQCNSVLDLPHRGGAHGAEASPWTEVAMHLAEELQPGHY